MTEEMESDKICKEEDSQSVCRVTIKPPQFMEAAVEAWFTILESQFRLNRIVSDSTMFDHVLSALPPNIVVKLPPSTLQSFSYGILRDEIIQQYERSKPELFEELISKHEMTGRPSTFMCELQAIARKVGVADDLVRHKFTQALPANIGPVLAAQRELSLTQLAKLADELVPLVAPPISCLTINSPSSNAHEHENRNVRRPTSASSSGVQPFHPGQRPRVCRAHVYYGPRARTCKPWCLWPNKRSDLVIQQSSRSSSRSSSPQRQTTPEN